MEYLKAFDDYANKKSYQNVADIKKDVKKSKEPTKKKKQDDAVIYGNQETIKELKKQSEKDKDQRSESGDMPPVASNVPDKSYTPSAKESPVVSKRATLPALSKTDTSSRVSPSDARKATLPAYGRSETAAKLSPSSKRKSTPPVVSKIKPSKSRPKTYHEKSAKPITQNGDKEGADVSGPKKNVRKDEQLYQNVTFEAQL